MKKYNRGYDRIMEYRREREQDVILGQLQGGPTCPSGVLYGGQGILFGKPTMEVYKLKKSQYTRESQMIKGAEVSSILQKGRI